MTGLVDPPGGRRWHVLVRGTVQGVGFRPFVHRVATRLALDGTVRNLDGNVLIEVNGGRPAVAELISVLREQAPPNAVVADVTVTAAPAGGPRAGFTVLPSTARAAAPAHGFTGLPVDLAVCDDCLRELFDPADRRYRYPFINCTACGPRATIIDELPYDRTRTAMAGFAMCARCAAEYHDPGDRRFHAEPIACPQCGPRLSWQGPAGSGPVGADALAAAVQAIGAGRIVALKGLGGYQLVCDATDPQAVEKLRTRKRRPRKPLAVMVADVPAAERLGELTAADRALLVTPARPIVLVPARPGGPPAPAVHPGTDRLGVFLPVTPLHQLLVRALARPLVVTSGNRCDEPTAIGNADAVARLSGIADGFLHHDRPIRARYDDSVVAAVAGARSTIRRARGYAPQPLPLPVRADRPVLAVGAQLKHTFTLARADRALVGPHGGSLDDPDALTAFHDTLAQLCRLHRFTPDIVAHDLHPGYASTRYAAQAVPADRRVAVQHHHAHVAACAAENGVEGPFIGVAYDGLGLGADGTLWGGEILLASYTGFRRVARFSTAPLPGGEAAVRRPARMALGHLYGSEFPLPATAAPALLARVGDREHDVLRRMVERGVNSPRASSAGRLFDTVASLLGVCDDAGYEGEAAIMLEAAAAGARTAPAALPWRLADVDGIWVYDSAVTLGALLDRAAAGEPVAALAAAFHRTIVDVTVALCERAAEASGVRVVCLSGGCLQNRILATGIPRALAAAGLDGRLHREVPAGDGGISYGQAVVAAARIGKGR
ncbi:carbamoyltransferase HypF [Actinoplanes sp. NPDC049599]|uniref:carbamoyltransferase HypF n=1 Tax=Actinoplanes sp. NPDC049599 TaxID=3363903 RepID=UPI00379F0C73